MLDTITTEESKNLANLFIERTRRSPDAIAYRYFDSQRNDWFNLTWKQIAADVARWQAAFKGEGLGKGDRVGILLRNCPEWVKYDQAALSLGLVIVPLYTNDRPENIAFIARDADIKCILFEDDEHWDTLSTVYDKLSGINRFISLKKLSHAHDSRITHIDAWLAQTAEAPAQAEVIGSLEPGDLASIVYTSGTTGNPKGVMLSHHNILWNAYRSAVCEEFYTTDVYLSFLPLSHMFERTVGYYMAMTAGAQVTYARSIEGLAEDLVSQKPTVMVTVPRIFERVYNKIKTQLAAKSPIASALFNATVNVGWHRFEYNQGRRSWHWKLLLWPVLHKLVAGKIAQKLGGRLRMAICGGAPLSFEVGRTFIALNVFIMQGYGMTELSPVVSVNRIKRNQPASVGIAYDETEVKLGTNDELLVRSAGIMMGYWNNPAATKEIIDDDGWLHTGDIARIEDDYIYITGRIKEIIVMANGEKLPPADLELAITTDPLFEQALVIGEGRAFMSAIVSLNKDHWKQLADKTAVYSDDALEPNHEKIKQQLLEHIKERLKSFPGFANVYAVHATLEPWTVEDELITPTLKLKRNKLLQKYQQQIEEFYKGH